MSREAFAFTQRKNACPRPAFQFVRDSAIWRTDKDDRTRQLHNQSQLARPEQTTRQRILGHNQSMASQQAWNQLLILHVVDPLDLSNVMSRSEVHRLSPTDTTPLKNQLN